ncbi:MAG: hypothetical protein HY296_06370 [Thaumarchaeota archaeon]|nr:hypothetical protein [Nitrososphaerota archaeon]
MARETDSPPLRDEGEVVSGLKSEVGLTTEEAQLYLDLLKNGSAPVSQKRGGMKKLQGFGMVILSGDGTEFIPVHPRLAVANSYRTWRESMVREINERRMRVDRLILELIPLYEAVTEKRAKRRGEGLH